MPKPLVDRLEGLAPVGRDRAAEPGRLQPLHRRHRHRGVRLPPPPLGPDRPELLPGLRRAGPAGHAPVRGRRRPGRRRRRGCRSPSRCLRCPAGARGRGGEPARARLRPGGRRRRAAPPRRAPAAASTSPGPRELLVVVDRLGWRAGGARADLGGGRRRLPGGRGRRAGAPRRRPAPVHRAPRVQQLRHPGRHGHPGALLLQQPARRLRRLQRIRRGAGVRRVADRPRSRSAASPRARSTPGPSRATRRAAGSCSSSRAVSAPIPTSRGRKLKAAQRRELLYGRKGRYVGIFPFLKGLEEKRYKQYIRVFLRQYQLAKTCADCGGTRLNPDALAVRIGGETIAEVAARSVDGIHEWLRALDAHGRSSARSRS